MFEHVATIVSFRRAVSVLALASCTVAGTAWGQTVLVSVSADTSVGTVTVRDQDLLFHGAGATARLGWPSETLALLAGDTDGDGLHDVFGDIDALHDGGPGPTADAGLVVSLVSNQFGFLDGDLLRPGAAGFEVVHDEATFVALVGALDGNVDVDAVHLDPDGSMLFSLAEDEDSAFLSGDVAGTVRDGAILHWTPGQAMAEVLFTESGVSAMVSQALGSTVSSGDTKGLARDPTTGEVWFTVQSPSAHDGTVFSSAAGGSLVAGQTESDFGFTAAAELDALTVAASEFTALSVSTPTPGAGTTFSISLAGGAQGSVHWLLASFQTGPMILSLPGWGGLVLQADEMYTASLGVASALALVPDGTGAASLAVPLPPSMLPQDITMQAVGLGGAWSVSNPLVLELSQ